MNVLDKVFQKFLVPQHIPVAQHGEFIEKRKEKERAEYLVEERRINEIHKSN